VITISLVLLALSFCGCITNIDSFPPAQYEMWSKQGKTQLEIKKAILECGFSTIYHPTVEDMKPEDYALASRCMENQDYIYRWRSYCPSFPADHRPSTCLSGVAIPEPSVEQRLNGPYCKKEWNRNRRECQP
jgi:hypothetical protein